MSTTHFGRNFFAFRCKNNKLKSTLKIIFEVFENIANGKAGAHKFQVWKLIIIKNSGDHIKCMNLASYLQVF